MTKSGKKEFDLAALATNLTRKGDEESKVRMVLEQIAPKSSDGVRLGSEIKTADGEILSISDSSLFQALKSASPKKQSVSISMKTPVLKKVDALAKAFDKDRSAIINTLLEEIFVQMDV